MQDNYFILLELDFDPIETSEDVILDAINRKVQEWQKDSRNPKKAVLAKSYLQNVDRMKEVMLNTSLRQEEALQAKAIQEKKRKDVYYDAVIKSTKGYLKTSEIDEIVEKYKEYKITAKDVVRKITVPIYEDELIDVIEGNDSGAIEVTDKSITNQLETYFENIGLDDMSIYEFLYTTPDESLENLLRITDDKLQYILQKGTKTTYDEITQKIAGIAKNIFSSEEKKIKYDNYLAGNRYAVVNRLVRDGAEANDNTVNANLYKVLISIICNDFGMNQSEATRYISQNIRTNGFSLDKNILSDMEAQKSFSVIFGDDEKNDNVIDEYEEFDPDDYEDKKDSREKVLNEFIGDFNEVNNDDSKEEKNEQQKESSIPQPEQTTEEQTAPPPADNQEITCQYINENVFPKVTEVLGDKRNEIRQVDFDVLKCINDAVNNNIIPSSGGIKATIIILPICIIVNLYFRWIFEYKLDELMSMAYLVFIIAMAVFFARALFYNFKTKKMFNAYSAIVEYKNRFETMCKTEWTQKDFNAMDINDVIPFTEKLKTNANKYYENVLKQKNAFLVEASKFKKPAIPFYFIPAAIISIVITIGIIALLVS